MTLDAAMLRAAILLGAGLVSCAPNQSSPPVRLGQAKAPPAASTKVVDEVRADASDAATPPEPPDERQACERRSELPTGGEENAAWVADISLNVALGLQVMPCARMARDHGPEDFFGQPTFVACSPARFCSAGPDGKPKTADDACSVLVDERGLGAASTGQRSARPGWTRRFLQIRKEMMPGCERAENAVVAFYAGLMRRDGSHLAALPPRSEWDKKLKRKLKKYEESTLVAARLEGMRCDEQGRCAFQIWLAVSVGAHVSSGRDQGIVAYRDGRWVVTDPPS